MRKVYESVDSLMIGHLKNLLLNEGIDSITKNEYLAGAMGKIPPVECWYEIWVTHDLQYEDAKTIIQNAFSGEESSGPVWICPSCGEEHEHQFSVCWNCGREKE